MKRGRWGESVRKMRRKTGNDADAARNTYAAKQTKTRSRAKPELNKNSNPEQDANHTGVSLGTSLRRLKGTRIRSKAIAVLSAPWHESNKGTLMTELEREETAGE